MTASTATPTQHWAAGKTTPEGYALILQAKRAAQKARETVAAAPAAIRPYVVRAIQTLKLEGPARVIARAASWLAGKLSWLVRAVKTVGIIESATLAVASERGQQVIKTAVSGVVRAATWVAEKVYSAFDWTLRLFGKPGNRLADWIWGKVVATGKRIAAVAAPVTHRVAQVTNPEGKPATYARRIATFSVIKRIGAALLAPSLGWVVTLAAVLVSFPAARRAAAAPVKAAGAALQFGEAMKAAGQTVSDQLFDASQKINEVVEGTAVIPVQADVENGPVIEHDVEPTPATVAETIVQKEDGQAEVDMLALAQVPVKAGSNGRPQGKRRR